MPPVGGEWFASIQVSRFMNSILPQWLGREKSLNYVSLLDCEVFLKAYYLKKFEDIPLSAPRKQMSGTDWGCLGSTSICKDDALPKLKTNQK